MRNHEAAAAAEGEAEEAAEDEAAAPVFGPDISYASRAFSLTEASGCVFCTTWKVPCTFGQNGVEAVHTIRGVREVRGASARWPPLM